MTRHTNTRHDINFVRSLILGSSLFIAALLSIMPLPIWLTDLNPPWLLMVLIYWLLRKPYHLGLGVAWLVGLFADLLHGSLLGEHAYAFVCIAFLISYFRVRINGFPFRQQMLIILATLALYQILLLWVSLCIGHTPDLWLYGLPSIAGTLLWPLLYAVLELVGKQSHA